MSALHNMSALSEANAEAEVRQRLQSPELWRRLELFRLAHSTSRTPKRAELAAGLLKDVEPRLLFLAVDSGYSQAGDEVKRRAVETALLSVFGSSPGPELFQVRAATVCVVPIAF